jgi:hypothetical protein
MPELCGRYVVVAVFAGERQEMKEAKGREGEREKVKAPHI